MATLKRFELYAKISSSNPSAIEPVLRKFFENKGTLTREGDDFVIKASLEGNSAKDLNRALLSELRRAEKKTRLRAEWSYNKTTERFFDYVLKKTEKRA